MRQEGYLEEVDGLTPAMLTAAYQQMLRTANIELLVLGCDAAQTAAIRDALLAELACIDRAPLPLVENMAMPAMHRCIRPKTTIWCRQSCVCCSHWGSPCSRSSWQQCALPWRCTAVV